MYDRWETVLTLLLAGLQSRKVSLDVDQLLAAPTNACDAAA